MMMHASAKWISAFLLGMMVSPACHHNAAPAEPSSGLGPDGGTPSTQPGDQPGFDPDTGAPIGPVANPDTSQYTDGLFAAPIAGSGGSGATGGSPIGGAGVGGGGGSGANRFASATRYVVAL